jgi:DNA-binding FadR family transcriptional regulator
VLAEQGVVASRQGSGVAVVERPAWSLAALATLIEGLASAPLPPWLFSAALEALALRRTFARRLPWEVEGRLGPGRLSRAREAADSAFELRGDARRAVERDALALRRVLEAAGAFAFAWLWNDLARAPAALASRLPGPAPFAPDYRARQGELFDALEAGDRARAERLLGAHLARLDRGLLAGAERAAPA